VKLSVDALITATVCHKMSLLTKNKTKQNKKTSLNNKQNKQYVDEFHWSFHVLHDQTALLKT